MLLGTLKRLPFNLSWHPEITPSRGLPVCVSPPRAACSGISGLNCGGQCGQFGGLPPACGLRHPATAPRLFALLLRLPGEREGPGWPVIHRGGQH